jgi:3-hydroxy-9,10-secoandrosta-1,3,5(10)-triene-9,17-dione monooxygenase reductase component
VSEHAAAAQAPIDPAHFREVLGHFSTGVAIVTAHHRDGPVGMTCQSVVSLSLDPPLVLFCAARTSTSWPRIRQSGHFCLNILATDQEELGVAFARSGGDKFAGVEWEPGRSGAPILAGALAHVQCELEAVHPGGDHEIVVGRVVDMEIRRDAYPLLFFRGSFGSLTATRSIDERLRRS